MGDAGVTESAILIKFSVYLTPPAWLAKAWSQNLNHAPTPKPKPHLFRETDDMLDECRSKCFGSKGVCQRTLLIPAQVFSRLNIYC